MAEIHQMGGAAKHPKDLLSAHEDGVGEIRNRHVHANILVRQFDYLLVAVVELNGKLLGSRIVGCDAAVVPLPIIVEHFDGVSDLLMCTCHIYVQKCTCGRRECFWFLWSFLLAWLAVRVFACSYAS
jgi:hypothetical protein